MEVPNLSPMNVTMMGCVEVYQVGCLVSVCVLLDPLTPHFGLFGPFLPYTLKMHCFSLWPSTKTVSVWCFIVWWPLQSATALRLVHPKGLLNEILKPLVTSIIIISSMYWRVVKFRSIFHQNLLLQYWAVRGQPHFQPSAISRSLSETYRTTFYLSVRALKPLSTLFWTYLNFIFCTYI